MEAQKKEEESAAPPAPAAEEEKPAMQEEPVQEPVPEPEVSYEAARAEQVAESAAGAAFLGALHISEVLLHHTRLRSAAQHAMGTAAAQGQGGMKGALSTSA